MKNKKIFCKRGHPFNKENSYIFPSGYRVCRPCYKINRKVWMNKNYRSYREKEKARIKNLSGIKKEEFLIRQRMNDKKLYEKRKSLIHKFKDVPCTDCKRKYPPCVMDFDHINRADKKFGIANFMGKSLKKIIKEIKKCEVVCANCHRIRTYLKYDR